MPLVLLGHSIGCYLAIHATHRFERHYLASSRVAAAALDSVARREWDHPTDAAAAGVGTDALQQELLAAARQQQPAAPEAQDAAAAKGASLGNSSSSGDGSGITNIVKVIGLYPFLTVDPDCSHQRRLQRLTRHHTALARVAGWLGVLPLGARRALVRLASPNLEPHAVDTTVQSKL